MPSIIYVGGTQPAAAADTGLWGSLKDLLPIGALLVGGYLLYSWISGQQSGSSSGGGGGDGSGGGGLLQQLQTQLTPTSQQTVTPPVGNSNPVHDVIATGPGGIIADVPQSGFVEGGKNTPIDYFPSGNVISTSRQLTPAEQQQVVQNLANTGITNAWWNQTPTPTAVTTPPADHNIVITPAAAPIYAPFTSQAAQTAAAAAPVPAPSSNPLASIANAIGSEISNIESGFTLGW